jgi:hypothetical protein
MFAYRAYQVFEEIFLNIYQGADLLDIQLLSRKGTKYVDRYARAGRSQFPTGRLIRRSSKACTFRTSGMATLVFTHLWLLSPAALQRPGRSIDAGFREESSGRSSFGCRAVSFT